jgi:hypothetical protein
MDEVRAVPHRPDRDHLGTLESRIQVLGPRDQSSRPPAYQQLVAAMATHRVVLRYRVAENEAPTTRDIGPLTLYLSWQWHVVAYCRLRQTIRTSVSTASKTWNCALKYSPCAQTCYSSTGRRAYPDPAVVRAGRAPLPAGRDAAGPGPAPARYQAPVRLGA